jgi:Ca2+-binding RTX toxin-like protein
VVTVNDLQGTSLTELGVDLRNTSGVGDNASDAVVVNGTGVDDVIVVSGDTSGVGVIGLSTTVSITGSEVALDRLTINALAGTDVIEASALGAGAIGLTGSGDAGDDVLLGSSGDDVLLGGDGDDVLIGGPGTDVLDGGSGDNVVIQ